MYEFSNGYRSSAVVASKKEQAFLDIGTSFKDVDILPNFYVKRILAATKIIFNLYPQLKDVFDGFFVDFTQSKNGVLAYTTFTVDASSKTVKCKIGIPFCYWKNLNFLFLSASSYVCKYGATWSVEGTIFHEFGHVLNAFKIAEKYKTIDAFYENCKRDWAYNILANNVLNFDTLDKSILRGIISTYATSDAGECFAEAFAINTIHKKNKLANVMTEALVNY